MERKKLSEFVKIVVGAVIPRSPGSSAELYISAAGFSTKVRK
jgi:hypothetical protein